MQLHRLQKSIPSLATMRYAHAEDLLKIECVHIAEGREFNFLILSCNASNEENWHEMTKLDT